MERYGRNGLDRNGMERSGKVRCGRSGFTPNTGDAMEHEGVKRAITALICGYRP